MTDDLEHCPECGGPLTTKSVSIDGNSVAAKVEWYYCLNCDWDNRTSTTGGESDGA